VAAAKVLENLRHGATVRTSDGHEVGRLHAVVVDPRTTTVTHVAVNRGPFFPEPGFGDPDITTVDLKDVADATEEHVDLRVDRAAFEKLPPYAHYHFLEIPEDEKAPPEARGRPALWDVGLAIAASLSNLATGVAVPAEHFRRAEYERHILNDAPVWRIQPNAQIGEVERVLVNEKTGEIEALVIKRGVLLHRDVVLPARYVREVQDGAILVQISDADLKALPEFG
jgi:sporulation protein YlmC with PRC-barrel domain